MCVRERVKKEEKLWMVSEFFSRFVCMCVRARESEVGGRVVVGV